MQYLVWVLAVIAGAWLQSDLETWRPVKDFLPKQEVTPKFWCSWGKQKGYCIISSPYLLCPIIFCVPLLTLTKMPWKNPSFLRPVNKQRRRWIITHRRKQSYLETLVILMSVWSVWRFSVWNQLCEDERINGENSQLCSRAMETIDSDLWLYLPNMGISSYYIMCFIMCQVLGLCFSPLRWLVRPEMV